MGALISSVVVVICVFIGVIINLTNLLNEDFDNVGIKSFFLFTVNSNIFSSLGMMMVIPYAIDGLRKNNYHLPNWVVVFLHTGTTAVTLTFLISLVYLTPVRGLEFSFGGTNFFLHGVCPIFTMISFMFFITDHRVKLKEALWTLVPVIIYAAVYFFMVLVIGEENGGWSDFYGFATKIPPYISLLAFAPITYGVSTLLRLKHNHSYKLRKKKEAEIYKQSFENADVREVIEKAGRSRAKVQKVIDIVVPARTIEIVVNGSDCTVDEGCQLFLNAYLDELKKAGK